MICHSVCRVLCFLLALPLFFSCASTGKVTYFNNVRDSVFKKQAELPEPVIHQNDILSITVSSLNPEASAIYNMASLPAGSSFATAGSNMSTPAGYLVTTNGMIQLPVLGQIKAEGITKKQLADLITRQLADKKLLLDPIVSVRQLNFHVTVLGEVNHPTVITVPNEKINILEAVGMAGDLTLYANRDNVLLIREENGDKMVKRIDLSSPKALSSPYYNLRSGDVIYAEPNKSKVRSTSEGRQILPIVLSGLSVVVIALDRIFR